MARRPEKVCGIPKRLMVTLGMISIQVTNVAYNVVAKLAVGGGGGGGAAGHHNGTNSSGHHTDKDGGVNPLIFSFLRDSLAFPLLMIMALVVDGRRLPAVGDVPRLVLLGLTGMFGNQFLFIYGLQKTTQTVATVTTRFQPVFGSMIAMLIGLEHFKWIKVASVLLAVAGAIMMMGDSLWKKKTLAGNLASIPYLGESASSISVSGSVGGGGVDDAEWFGPASAVGVGSHANDLEAEESSGAIGIIVLLSGAFSMSLFYVLQKPIVKKYPPVSITAWSYFSGALSMGLACLYYVPWSREWEVSICTDAIKKGQIQNGTHNDGGNGTGTEPGCSFKMWSLNEIQWIAVIVAVILNSVLKYILITVCNKHATVTEIMMWGTLVVPLGAAADPLFLHSHLSPSWAYAGIVPIFIGLGLIFKANNSTQGKDATKSDVVLKAWQRPLLKLLCGASALPENHSELAPLLINDDQLLSGGRR